MFFFDYFNIQWGCNRPQMHKHHGENVFGAQKPPLGTSGKVFSEKQCHGGFFFVVVVWGGGGHARGRGRGEGGRGRGGELVGYWGAENGPKMAGKISSLSFHHRWGGGHTLNLSFPWRHKEMANCPLQHACLAPHPPNTLVV